MRMPVTSASESISTRFEVYIKLFLSLGHTIWTDKRKDRRRKGWTAPLTDTTPPLEGGPFDVI